MWTDQSKATNNSTYNIRCDQIWPMSVTGQKIQSICWSRETQSIQVIFCAADSTYYLHSIFSITLYF